MTTQLQMIPYDAMKPETIALDYIESLPWATKKTEEKAINLASGLVKARELGLASQVNLHFANLKRLAKKSVADSIRSALEQGGLVLEPQIVGGASKVEDYQHLIPTDMLDLMGLIREMIPIAQFRINTPYTRCNDPYLVVGIPGGGWWRVGSWYRPNRSHVLIDAGKVNLRELLQG